MLQNLVCSLHKFNEHKRLTSGGGAYYTKLETKLRSEHSQVYHSIQSAVTEDRISEEDARDAVDLLITVGESTSLLQLPPMPQKHRQNSVRLKNRSGLK